ncbi:transposase [Thalassobacillus hwangdonensis]|uniref:Transposase n=1 Tax=Thalassobacillus hwangdonensis TaxID=546108 RepID=A0ABW3L382_9BACI
MPRKRRIWYPGCTYHITARGNRKDTIFFDDKDYRQYLHLLAESKIYYPHQIHAYCLMRNHVHLLLETIEHPPGDIIKFVHFRYAIYFNKRYDFIGHLFQDRFHSQVIKSLKYMRDTSKYIHLNPVEAKLVKEPQDFKWSSYRDYLSDQDSSLVSKYRILEMFEYSPEKYHSYMKEPHPLTSPR